MLRRQPLSPSLLCADDALWYLSARLLTGKRRPRAQSPLDWADQVSMAFAPGKNAVGDLLTVDRHRPRPVGRVTQSLPNLSTTTIGTPPPPSLSLCLSSSSLGSPGIKPSGLPITSTFSIRRASRFPGRSLTSRRRLHRVRRWATQDPPVWLVGRPTPLARCCPRRMVRRITHRTGPRTHSLSARGGSIVAVSVSIRFLDTKSNHARAMPRQGSARARKSRSVAKPDRFRVNSPSVYSRRIPVRWAGQSLLDSPTLSMSTSS